MIPSGSKLVPVALLVLRAAAGPGLIVAVIAGAPGVILAVIVMLAFLSDVFDGIIARRLGVATEALRSADSIIDTIFYVAASIGLALHAPGVIAANLIGIAIVLGLELTRQALERIKFGRMAAYHMWSAKAWGITLLLGFCEAFITGAPGPLFRVAIVMGIVADLEGLAASFVLSKWHNDVPSLWHAVNIEKAEDHRC